jgi:hypothetical protein
LRVVLRGYSAVIGYDDRFLCGEGIASVACCNLPAGMPHDSGRGNVPTLEEVDEGNLDGSTEGLGEVGKVDMAGFLRFEEFIWLAVSEGLIL